MVGLDNDMLLVRQEEGNMNRSDSDAYAAAVAARHPSAYPFPDHEDEELWPPPTGDQHLAPARMFRPRPAPTLDGPVADSTLIVVMVAIVALVATAAGLAWKVLR